MQPPDEQLAAIANSQAPARRLGPPALPAEVDGLTVVRVPPDLRLRAAERIVGSAGDGRGGREAAARAFIESAGKLGIDVSLMWGTLDPSGRYFHQVCLVVIGAGRTGMLFLSDDDDHSTWDFGLPAVERIRQRDAASGIAQRRAILEHLCDFLASLRGTIEPGAAARPRRSPRVILPGQQSVILVQALLETSEHEAAVALSGAGFIRLGDLAYMRRPLAGAASRRQTRADSPNWPPGITVRPLSQIDASEHDELLARALARSYIDTLDCPELCGLRSVDDVIDSHRAVGTLDLSKWWIVQEHGQVEGAMLLSACPEQTPASVELVYLGLSPSLRGRGLGAGLLKMGLAAVSGGAAASITCAVDSRNAPAMKLYKRAGFQRFSLRVPMVKGLGPPESA
ncbi:MAG: GNAT family N-acetyltransferase [Phycisphaerales bacterium]